MLRFRKSTPPAEANKPSQRPPWATSEESNIDADGNKADRANIQDIIGRIAGRWGNLDLNAIAKEYEDRVQDYRLSPRSSNFRTRPKNPPSILQTLRTHFTGLRFPPLAMQRRLLLMRASPPPLPAR